MDWIKKLFFKQYPMIGFDEAVPVKEVIKRARRHSSDPAVQANLVSNRLRLRIQKDIVSLDKEIAELYNYFSNKKHVKRKRKRAFIERLLLNLLEIMAEYEYRHKDQVRNILTLLYQLYPNAPETIRGEVFFFEYAHCTKSMNSITEDMEEKNTEKKQFNKKLYYMIDMVACWSPPNIHLLDSDHVRCATYLDFPLTHGLQDFRGDFRDYTLMANSLYFLFDNDLMLYLLRCGTSVSGCLLWFVGVATTMHLALAGPDVQSDFLKCVMNPESHTSQIIRYFCRTKRWIYLHLLPKDGTIVTGSKLNVSKFPKGISHSDILVLPESLVSLVPVDRHKEPSKLLHQCRLTIRRELQKLEQLPDGPQKLPLPASLRNYVDLLED